MNKISTVLYANYKTQGFPTTTMIYMVDLPTLKIPVDSYPKKDDWFYICLTNPIHNKMVLLLMEIDCENQKSRSFHRRRVRQ